MSFGCSVFYSGKESEDMKKKRLILLTIFVIALVVRLGILANTHHTYFGSGMVVDDGDAAHHIVKGEGYVINEQLVSSVQERQIKLEKLVDYEDVQRPKKELLTSYNHSLPGYAFLLAITYKIFGHERYVYLQIIQAIIDALLVFLVFFIANQLFGRIIGILSAFLFAIWIPEARLSVAALHDAPMSLIVITSTYFFVKYTKNNKLRWVELILSFIILGFGCYVRSDFILLPIFFGFATYLYFRDFRKAFLLSICGLLIIFTILFPWGIRNYYQFGKFQFTRTVLWQSIWEGFGEFKNPFGAVQNDEVTLEQVQEEYPNVEYASPEYQEILKGKVIEALKSDSIWYIAMLPRRLLNMLLLKNSNNWGFPMNPQLSFRSQNISLSKYVFKYPSQFLYRAIPRVFEPLLFLLALGGIWVRRKMWKDEILILCVPVYAILSHLPIYWEPRYILPAQFPYLIFCATFLYYLANKFDKVTGWMARKLNGERE